VDLKVAVFGLFHKEALMIPYWQNYYGNLFGRENLYPVGDLKNDFFMSLFSIPRKNFIELGAHYQSDYDLHVSTVSKVQKQLLDSYDVVIFAEADEFFVPDLNKYTDLKDFLIKNPDDYFTAQGYNVISDIDDESPINPTKSLLSQRRWWYKNAGESKTLIVRKPVTSYSGGFHICYPSIPEHPELFNIHLHDFDYNYSNARAKMRFDTLLPLHPSFRPGNMGSEGYILDEELVLFHRHKFETKGVELIPEMFVNSGLV
jgi:hypothetical protein